jgi:hypothetical protein
MGGQPAGQLQESAQPWFLGSRAVGRIHEGAAPGKKRAEAGDEDFVEEVHGPAELARILKLLEVDGKAAGRGSGGKNVHARHQRGIPIPYRADFQENRN